jgi:hypothetical protein
MIVVLQQAVLFQVSCIRPMPLCILLFTFGAIPAGHGIGMYIMNSGLQIWHCVTLQTEGFFRKSNFGARDRNLSLLGCIVVCCPTLAHQVMTLQGYASWLQRGAVKAWTPPSLLHTSLLLVGKLRTASCTCNKT